MTRKDIDDIISILCPNDEDYEKPIISPKYLRQELEQLALEQEPCEDIGEVSDGYHTFNQLYHQRAILFATIVNQNKDRAWKSYKHEDGKYCFDKDGEWFIVGIDTPKGSYTYHYSKEYWDYFDCEELECGKPWDGHTEEDVTRLLSLPSVTPQQRIGHWIDIMVEDMPAQACDQCNTFYPLAYTGGGHKYCPNCGAKMESEDKE